MVCSRSRPLSPSRGVSGRGDAGLFKVLHMRFRELPFSEPLESRSLSCGFEDVFDYFEGYRSISFSRPDDVVRVLVVGAVRSDSSLISAYLEDRRSLERQAFRHLLAVLLKVLPMRQV